MTGEVGRDIASLFQVVDLRVVLRENCVMLLLLALLHVNKGVAGAGN